MREDKTTGAVPTQDRYYRTAPICCAASRTAPVFLDTVRAHGTMENSRPWVLEVVPREDHARARQEHAPAHRAMLPRVALNTIQAKPDKGSKRLKFKRAGWEERFLRKLIAQC
jgi:predicted transposase YbfD/YdcC